MIRGLVPVLSIGCLERSRPRVAESDQVTIFPDVFVRKSNLSPVAVGEGRTYAHWRISIILSCCLTGED